MSQRKKSMPGKCNRPNKLEVVNLCSEQRLEKTIHFLETSGAYDCIENHVPLVKYEHANLVLDPS